jgi:ParB family chromosome partitioning protein
VSQDNIAQHANASAEILIEVEVERLRPNPYQVRILDVTDPALEQLKDSISKFGLIEPIIVRSTADGWFEIAAGHRRWQCHVLLGIPKIKCIQRDLTDEQMCEAILDENLKRQSLNPIDEGKAYRNLKDKFAWTDERTAVRYHVSRDLVAQRRRLLTFQQAIQDLVAKGDIGVSHAEAIATAPASKQLELARTVTLFGLTVSDTSERAKHLCLQDKANRDALENIGVTVVNFDQRLKAQETRPMIRFIGATADAPVIWLDHPWKANSCKHNINGTCDRFSWSGEPTTLVEQLRDIAKFEKLPDERWHIQACQAACGRCDLYEERPPVNT